jgi:beta-N-acetylhexosaminidase
MKRQS